MIEVGQTVRVASLGINDLRESSTAMVKYIGQTGTVTYDYGGRGYRYVVTFDDPVLQSNNQREGGWCFQLEDLEVVA